MRRHGFHGLSEPGLPDMGELERVAGAGAAGGRVVLCALCCGASLAAVRGGRPVDTTMGFTPASGLVMGTRTGDIDPGLVRFLVEGGGASRSSRSTRWSTTKSGLLGVSETSPDLRDLLARQGEDVAALLRRWRSPWSPGEDRHRCAGRDAGRSGDAGLCRWDRRETPPRSGGGFAKGSDSWAAQAASSAAPHDNAGREYLKKNKALNNLSNEAGAAVISHRRRAGYGAGHPDRRGGRDRPRHGQHDRSSRR